MRLQAKHRAETHPLVKLLSDAEKTNITLFSLRNSLNYTQEFLQVFRNSSLITSIQDVNPKLWSNIDEWFDDIHNIITLFKQLKQSKTFTKQELSQWNNPNTPTA
jgi:hypothetical protein